MSLKPSNTIGAIRPEVEDGQDCEDYYWCYIEKDDWGNIVYLEVLGYAYSVCVPNQDPSQPGGVVDYYIDCAGVRDGSAYNSDCGCIGGTTGIAECPREIIDSVQNPCLKASLSLAISNELNNQIIGYMSFTFGPTSKKNLIFYESSNLANQDDGITNGSQYEINIYLNSNTLPNYSREYAVATIYNEVLHAYLNSLFQPNSNGSTFINIPNQHEYMATNYVTMTKDALTAKFPGMSANDSWGLAWGGLQETSFWNILTDSAKQQIIDINKNYSNRGSVKKGVYCN